MNTTLLELTNQVLVSIREEPVIDLTSPYASLIASLVNDAVYQVEAAHDWSALFVEFIETILSDEEVILSGRGDRIKIDYIVSNTSNLELIKRTRRWMTSEFIKNGALYGTPSSWCNKGVSQAGATAGDATIQLDRVPLSGPETITIVGWQRSPRLTADSDTILVPATPVRDLAIALAVRERGEADSQTAQEYFVIAKRTLADAISFDSARNDDEDVWYAV